MNRKRVKKWLIIIAIVYVTGGIVLYFLQDAILFHPVTLKRDHQYSFPQPHREIDIPISEDDTLNLVLFETRDTVKRGVVLYFHGNKKNISRYAKYPPYFTKHGYEVIMIDYPGFGKSKGKFSEQTLYDWSEQVYKLARTRFPADSIVIYGKSMGTGIAAQLAMREKCKQLILETPYTDLPSVLKRYLFFYPINWMIHYKLPTYKYLPLVEAPIVIFHGTSDGVISYSNAKRLEPLLKSNDEFVTIRGGSHNDLYNYPLMLEKLDSLLSL